MTGINTIPFTPRSIKTLNAALGTANTDRTGASGTVVQFKNANANYTTGTDGALLTTLRIKFSVTSSAGEVRIFIKDGTTVWLVEEIAVTVVSIAAGTNGFSSVTTLNLYVPPTYTIHATVHNSEACHVTIDCLEY